MVFGSSIFDRATELNLQNMTGTVRIVCGEPYTVFEVHRTLLRNASPFFRNHLATTTDSHPNPTPVIQIPPHYTARACHEYVKYLYGNTVLYNVSFEVKLEAYLLAKFLGEKTPFLNACLRAIQSSPPSICQLAVPEDFFTFAEENDAARQFIMQHIARGLLKGGEISQSLDNHLPDSAWRKVCLEVAAEGKKAKSYGNAPGQSLFSNTGLFGTQVTGGTQSTCGLFGNTQNKPQGGLFGNFAPPASQTQRQGGLFGNSTSNASQNQQQGKGGFGTAGLNDGQGLFASDNKAGGLFASKANDTSASLPFGAQSGNTGLAKAAPYVSPFNSTAQNSAQKAPTFPCLGTHGVAFAPVHEPEWNGQSSAYQSISMMPAHKSYSHEELRYTDYQTTQRPAQSQHSCSTNCIPGSQTNTLNTANPGKTENHAPEVGARQSAFSTPCQIFTPTSSRESSPGNTTFDQGVPAQQIQQQGQIPQEFGRGTSTSNTAANSLAGGFVSKAATSSLFGNTVPSQPGFTRPQFGHAAEPVNGIKPTDHYCTPGCDHAVRQSTEQETRDESPARAAKSAQNNYEAISKRQKYVTEHVGQVAKDDKLEDRPIAKKESKDTPNPFQVLRTLGRLDSPPSSIWTTDLLHGAIRKLEAQVATLKNDVVALEDHPNVVNSPTTTDSGSSTNLRTAVQRLDLDVDMAAQGLIALWAQAEVAQRDTHFGTNQESLASSTLREFITKWEAIIAKTQKDIAAMQAQVEKATPQVETAGKDAAATSAETDSMATYHATVKQLQSQLTSSQKAVADLQAQLNVVKSPFEAARQGAAALPKTGSIFGSGTGFGSASGSATVNGFGNGKGFGSAAG